MRDLSTEARLCGRDGDTFRPVQEGKPARATTDRSPQRGGEVQEGGLETGAGERRFRSSFQIPQRPK